MPIVGGGRVAGEIGRFSLGIMNIQTDSIDLDHENDTVKLRNEKVTESNYGVVRIKRDLLQRSSIGAFLVNTARAGTKFFNLAYGVDGNFTFKRYLNINGVLLTPELVKDRAQYQTKTGLPAAPLKGTVISGYCQASL